MQARNILANLSPNPTRPEKPSPTYNSDRIAYETLWISFPFARQFHCVRFLAVWKANKYVNRESISSKHFGGFYRTHFASSSNCCSWLRHVCEIFATVVWWASNNVVLNPFCVNAFTPPHICEACFVLGNWRYCALRQGQIYIKPLKYVGYVAVMESRDLVSRSRRLRSRLHHSYVVVQIFQCDISGHSPVEIKNPVPVSQARFRQFGVIENFYAESMKAATNAMIAGHSIQIEYWRSSILSYSA